MIRYDFVETPMMSSLFRCQHFADMSTSSQGVFTQMAKIEDYYRVTSIAEKFGIPRQTVQSAVGRGELRHKKTACGLALVSLTSMEEWMCKTQVDSRRPYKTPTPQASAETGRQLLTAAKRNPELAKKIEAAKERISRGE